MKRILTVSVAGVLTCILMIATMLCAVAAPDSTVNGVEAPKGSTVEYTLFLESYKQDVVGIQMIFKFDTKHLELKNVDLKNFPSATVNANNQGDGMIYFNDSTLKGQSFKEAKEVAKLTFEVIGDGASDIVYLVQYLYDIDLVNIYDYTLTYSLSVDGAEQIKNETPVLGDVDKIADEVDGFDQGDFENNKEGTGSGIKPTTAPKAPVKVPSDNNDKDGGDGNTTLIVIGVIVGLLLVAVVILAISKKKKND